MPPWTKFVGMDSAWLSSVRIRSPDAGFCKPEICVQLDFRAANRLFSYLHHSIWSITRRPRVGKPSLRSCSHSSASAPPTSRRFQEKWGVPCTVPYHGFDQRNPEAALLTALEDADVRDGLLGDATSRPAAQRLSALEDVPVPGYSIAVTVDPNSNLLMLDLGSELGIWLFYIGTSGDKKFRRFKNGVWQINLTGVLYLRGHLSPHLLSPVTGRTQIVFICFL